MSSVCPECGGGQGDEIPGRPGEYYSKVVMVEIRGVYDGGLFYMCPFCGHTWHRWKPENGKIYTKAVYWMAMWKEATVVEREP